MSSNTIIVDDQDSRLKYSGPSWTFRAEELNYNRTLYSSGAAGAAMSFVFNGTSLSVMGSLTGGGTCNTTFAVDGRITRFDSPNTNTPKHHQTLWTSATLSDDEHTFIYSVLGCENTAKNKISDPMIWLDYLFYNPGTSIPATAKHFVDDADSAVQYSGNWDTTSDDRDFRQTRHGGRDGAEMSYQFEGTSIAVYGRISDGSATKASFKIDDSPSTLFDQTAQDSVSLNKALFNSPTLSSGKHTLVVKGNSENPIWIDYMIIDSTKDSGPSSKSTSLGMIIGVSVGAAAVLAVVAFFFFYRWKKKSRVRLPPSKRVDIGSYGSRVPQTPYIPPEPPKAHSFTGRTSPTRRESAAVTDISHTPTRRSQHPSHRSSSNSPHQSRIYTHTPSHSLTASSYMPAPLESPTSSEFPESIAPSLAPTSRSRHSRPLPVPGSRARPISMAPSYTTTVTDWSNPFSTVSRAPSRAHSNAAFSEVSQSNQSNTSPMPFLDEDPDSIAALKRRQQLLVANDERLRHAPSASSAASFTSVGSRATARTHGTYSSTQPLVHRDAGMRLNPQEQAGSQEILVQPRPEDQWGEDLPPSYTPR